MSDPLGLGTTTINGVNDAGDLVGFYTDAAGNTDGLLWAASRHTAPAARGLARPVTPAGTPAQPATPATSVTVAPSPTPTATVNTSGQPTHW